MCELGKYGVARRIIIVTIIMNVIFIMLKAYLFLLTSSLVVLAYLIDSLMDILNDAIALYGVKMASLPPDHDHPYGHAKYDAFIAIIISSLIIAGAIEIFRDTIQRVLYGEHYVYYDSRVGLIFLIFCIGYSLIALVEFMYSRKLNIATMEASAMHYVGDPLFTIIVFVGVYLAHMGYLFVDVALSVGIGLLLLYSAVKQIKKSSVVLLDIAVVDREHMKRMILEKFPGVIDVHAIRSRSDGTRIFLEFHIWLQPDISLREAHEKAHEIQEYIQEKLIGENTASIIIHMEPAEDYKEGQKRKTEKSST